MRKTFTVLESIKVQTDPEFVRELSDLCNNLIVSFKKYSHYAGSNLNIHLDSKYANVNIEHKSDMYSEAEFQYLTNLTDIKDLLSVRFNLSNLNIINNNEYSGLVSILLPRHLDTFSKVTALKLDPVSVYEDRVIGTINLRDAKLSGEISGLNTTLIFNLDVVISVVNLTGGELAAIILHEIGHLFAQYEQAFKIAVVNNLITSLAQDRGIKDDPNKIKLVLVDSIFTLDSDFVYNNDSLPMLTAQLYRSIIKSSKAAMFTYSMNLEQENLADLFAVRFGMAKELASAFQKLDKFSTSNMVKYNNIFLEVDLTLFYLKMAFKSFIVLGAVFSAISLTLIGLGIIGLTPFITGLYIFTGISVVGYLLTPTDITVKGEHPSHVERTDRIKKEYIRQLKVLHDKLSNEEINGLLSSIEELEQTSKRLLSKNVVFKEMQEDIVNLLDTGSYKRIDETMVEKILEAFSNNDIFVDSAKLKLLSGE